MNAGDELDRTIDEYQNTLSEVLKCVEINKDLRFELFQRKLNEICGWTTEGAEEIVMLARKYGAFMLRNALAIANVLNIEDGELGY